MQRNKEIYFQNYGRYNIEHIWQDDILPCRLYIRYWFYTRADVTASIVRSQKESRVINEKKMELYQARVKFEEGKLDDSVVKECTEHIQYGVRGKPTSILELPLYISFRDLEQVKRQAFGSSSRASRSVLYRRCSGIECI